MEWWKQRCCAVFRHNYKKTKQKKKAHNSTDQTFEWHTLMFTERRHGTFAVERVWKLSLSCPPVQQGASGSPATLAGTSVNMWDGVQLAVKLLANVPPVRSPLHLADCIDTPGRNKSRRPRREKPFAGPLGNLRGSTHSRCFSCRGFKQEGVWGGGLRRSHVRVAH